MNSANKLFITGGSGLLGLNWGYHSVGNFLPVLNLHERKVSPENLQTSSIALDNVGELIEQLGRIGPKAVIHTAGITSIEFCEANRELAEHVNTNLAVNVCLACRELGIPMVHISTDNFFDGSSPLASEDETPKPLNIYAQTKARAEEKILKTYKEVLIVRTNFYGWGPAYKPSFSDTILQALRNGKSVSLFEDVMYTPILMSELISSTHTLLEKGYRGIFHIVGDERLSKHDFGLRLAEVFHQDKGLVCFGQLSKMTRLTARSFDMSMSNMKVANLLGRSLGDITMHLNKLKEEETTNIVKAIHEIYPLR